MPHDVFISYSRRDLAAVKPIKEELESLGFSCWMDLEGIESGSEEFTQSIVSAIEGSTAVLFFLSASSQESEWSLKELRFAKSTKKRTVIVRFNEDAMTPVFSFNFGGADVIDWRIPVQKGKLLRDLSSWTGRGATETAAADTKQSGPDRQAPSRFAASRKSKFVFFLLGVLFGALGLHNFYIGRTKQGTIQLLITLVSFGMLSILTWVWAIVEVFNLMLSPGRFPPDSNDSLRTIGQRIRAFAASRFH